MSSKDAKDKRTINAYLDKDVADVLSDQYSGISSKILNNLSKKFIEEVQKEPAMLSHVLFGSFSITAETKEKKKG